MNSILVRGTNWVGDAVMSVPALRELRRIFPDARISLHTRGWARGIFEDAEFIDEILTFEKTKSKIKDSFAQSSLLRKRNFDLAVLFPNSFESALVAKLSGVARRFGYAKEGRSFLLTDAIEIPAWKNRRHEVYYYLNLIAEIEKSFFQTETVSAAAPQINLPVSAERREAAKKLLIEIGSDPTKKTVALGVGSTNSAAKRWHAESFAELNDRLQIELGANVVLVGASDETDMSQTVFDRSAKKPFVLTGKTSLAEAVAVLSAVDLLVSNDMGLAHIAPAVGTKTLVIFGPTNEKTTRPFSENAHTIRCNVECSPCMLRVCPIDHRCMTRILPGEVFDKAVEMIYDTMPNDTISE
jgi:heptosyltransferase-2